MGEEGREGVVDGGFHFHRLLAGFDVAQMQACLPNGRPQIPLKHAATVAETAPTGHTCALIPPANR